MSTGDLFVSWLACGAGVARGNDGDACFNEQKFKVVASNKKCHGKYHLSYFLHYIPCYWSMILPHALSSRQMLINLGLLSYQTRTSRFELRMNTLLECYIKMLWMTKKSTFRMRDHYALRTWWNQRLFSCWNFKAAFKSNGTEPELRGWHRLCEIIGPRLFETG